jgi:hypothetical protein
MTTIDYLEKQYIHAFDMVKFGETKNMSLIAFNGAMIVGMTKLLSDTKNDYLMWYLIYVIAMCGISIFICLSAIMAKIKHSSNETELNKSNNLLFYATVAQMTPVELIIKLKKNYECESSNPNHEADLAKQAIITSQIACRKFKLFNIAIGFTFAGTLTPLSIIIYRFTLNHDK